jgi:hypothetical protein
MDNAPRAWELPEPMRWARFAVLGALAALAFVRIAEGATPTPPALEQASPAHTAEPVARDAALAALSRGLSAKDDELRQVANDPRVDPWMQRLAERELVDALVAAGSIDEAAAETRHHGDRLDPPFVKQVGRLLLLRAMRRAAFAVLATFALFVAVSLWRAGRRHALHRAAREVRTMAPVAVCFAAFVVVAGGVLASRYETGSAIPFVLLGAGLLPLLFLGRAWSAVGSQSGPSRAARGLLCGATVVAEAFVVLDLCGPQYLLGFGL